MNLFEQIQNYKALNRQEECDKAQMLQFMRCNRNFLERENLIAHFTASMWTGICLQSGRNRTVSSASSTMTAPGNRNNNKTGCQV